MWMTMMIEVILFDLLFCLLVCTLVLLNMVKMVMLGICMSTELHIK